MTGLRVFVDSSVWFAAANIRERRNAHAKDLLMEIAAPVTTDHVVIETWLLLNSRIGRNAAEQFWRRLRIQAISVEVATIADLEAAWAIGEAFPDQQFSVVDRTSFAVMQRIGITRAASFDEDFAIYRYGRDRKQAFDLIR